ncbi:MAG: LacI family DNA-binding transcriptional regulator [Roseobacter sp.]
MEQFAALSGISRPTISKYFHDPSSVRPKTRQRIEEALELHDYRPNFYAINQNRKLTKNIGIVVPYLADPFFSEMARMIERYCIDAGYSPNLFSSHGDPEQEIEILEGLRSMKPAGVLLAPIGRVSHKSKIEAFCSDVPTVLFDSNLDDVGASFVGSDNYSFVSQTVEYLTQTGTAPSFLEMRTPANPNARKRRAAYIQKMEDMSLTPKILSIDGTGWEFEEIGRAGGMKLIAENALQADTVLCSNDRLAIGFLSACYANGLRVGRSVECDLRVASHDDHPLSRFACPALTTAAHDYASVSERSVETLFDLIADGGSTQTRSEVLFPARLVVRASA